MPMSLSKEPADVTFIWQKELYRWDYSRILTQDLDYMCVFSEITGILVGAGNAKTETETGVMHHKSYQPLGAGRSQE